MTFEYIYNKEESQIILYANTNLGQFAVKYEDDKLVLKNISTYEKENRFFIKKIE